MSKKASSTISQKPSVDPKLEQWIGGANENSSAAPSAAIAQPASQQTSQLASIEATKMLSVRIPADLHQKLRVHAVSQSLQIQDIVVSLVQGYLSQQEGSH